jgi:hypothetical protein
VKVTLEAEGAAPNATRSSDTSVVPVMSATPSTSERVAARTAVVRLPGKHFARGHVKVVVLQPSPLHVIESRRARQRVVAAEADQPVAARAAGDCVREIVVSRAQGAVADEKSAAVRRTSRSPP